MEQTFLERVLRVNHGERVSSQPDLQDKKGKRKKVWHASASSLL